MADARRERRRLLADGAQTAPVTHEALPGTVHELAREYLQARAPLLAPSTVNTIDEAYRLRIAPTFRDTPLEQLTRPRIEAWLGRLLATGSSAHAVRKALASLRAMLSFAVEAGVLDRNPALRIKVADPPADPDSPPPVERVLDDSELRRLFAACENAREEVIVRLAAESGLRSGEVRGLRWPDVDLPARRITVRRAIWRNIVKQTKGKRPRRIAITPALASALARHYEAEVLERGRDANGYVLTGRDGIKFIGADTPLEVAQTVQRRAGLVVKSKTPMPTAKTTKPKTRVTYHELRHTAATVMLTGGASATVVARQLGHKDSRITTSVYEHLLHDGLLDEALDPFVHLSDPVEKVAGEVAGDQASPAEAAKTA